MLMWGARQSMVSNVRSRSALGRPVSWWGEDEIWVRGTL